MPPVALLTFGLVGVLLVSGWLVSQLRMTRRRRWANEAATALRIGELEMLQRIPPWADGLDEVLLEARDRLERADQNAHRICRELREAQRVFQDAPLALFLLDDKGRIELANRRALVLFERTSRGLIGHSLAEFGLLRDAGTGRERGEASPRPIALELERPGGVVSIRLFDAAPRSDERRIVAALEVASLQKERTEPLGDLEAVGRFAGSVAHDFNDLLTAMLGRASVMISECPDASPLHRDLSEIMTAGEQARLLTHQLMALSRQSIVGRSPAGSSASPTRPSGPAMLLRSSETHTAPADRATICVVEDDEAVRRFVATVLEREGNVVLAAGNSRECLERCRAHAGTIDLLVSDVHMPAMYGPELYLDLLKERPEVGALFMSGFVERDLFLADQGRAYEFLQKPFTALELVTSVRAALRRRSGPPARILVVGGAAELRGRLEQGLRALGAESVFVADAREALGVLESSRVDAVVCSMESGTGGGVQACSEILRRRPRTRLVALLGRSQGEDRLALARTLGAAAELAEPFGEGELARALEKALASEPVLARSSESRSAGAA
jgi:CheY-like chemotaxis protein/PAS domain-containing protein